MLSGYHGDLRALCRRRARGSPSETLAKSSVLPIARQNARVSPQAGTFRTTQLRRRSRPKKLSTEIDHLLEKKCHPCRRSKVLPMKAVAPTVSSRFLAPSAGGSASKSARRTLVEIGAIHTPLRFPRLSRIVTATQNERSRARPQPRAAPAGASSLGSAAAQLVARARPERRRRRSARATTLGPTPGDPTDELEQTKRQRPELRTLHRPCCSRAASAMPPLRTQTHHTFPSPSCVPPPRAASSVRPFGPHTEPRGLHR